METFPKYGSIQNLYKCKEILDREVVVTEKLHGTNVRFMWCEEHGLVLGGRNITLYKDGQKNENDGYSFSHYMLNNSDIDFEQLKRYENYVFYGEFHGAGIQKGITYLNGTDKDLRIFDVRNPDGDYISWFEVCRICCEIGIKTVPAVCIGVFTMEDMEKLLNQPSVTATENGVTVENNLGEGVVIKPVKPQTNRYGEWMRTKFKGERWKEKASKPKVPKPISEAQIALNENAVTFAQEVVTNGRVHTVVEHITRDGNTKIDMSRTPDFLKELSADIWAENEELKTKLEKNEVKVYNKAVSSQGMALWKKFVEENYRG